MSWQQEIARQRAALRLLASLEAEASKRLDVAFAEGDDDALADSVLVVSRVAQARSTVLMALAALEQRAMAEAADH
jgi:hypothetical protein